jgi:hypothetical protein
MKEKKAASPAISMVIITAATVVLVLVAGSFAVSVLDSQQASTEFNALQKSILALDDAVRDVAWKNGASRSVRFATGRGSFLNISTTSSIEISFNDQPLGDPVQTSIIKYVMSDNYIALENEEYYILGKGDSVVSSLSDSVGQVWLAREPGFAAISLGYRVRVSYEGTYSVLDDGEYVLTDYVNVYVIRLSSVDLSLAYGDFDMVAKNIGLTTNLYKFSNIDQGNISVSVNGTQESSVSIDLTGAQVVVNVVISDVSVIA